MAFLKKKSQIKRIYEASGNTGCIASNRITIDGAKVGYMYREKVETDSKFPDSGWRFFAGDEDEEYTDNPDHFNIFELNTICNYDESIITYLNSEPGKAYFKKGKTFVEEPLISDE